MPQVLEYRRAIDAQTIVMAEQDYAQCIPQIANALRQQALQKPLSRFHRLFIPIYYLVCAFGILVSLLPLLPSSSGCYTDESTMVLFFMFFCLAFYGMIKRNTIGEWCWKKFTRHQHQQLRERTFSSARLEVPFTAIYHWQDQEITYRREPVSAAAGSWKRPLADYYIARPFYILLYRKKHYYPIMFLWRDEEDHLLQRLNTSQVQPHPVSSNLGST
ncbi:MAG: hypothetical protein RL497_585 [Pseudomonadota bacterium]